MIKQLIESILTICFIFLLGSCITNWLEKHGYKYESSSYFGDYDDPDA